MSEEREQRNSVFTNVTSPMNVDPRVPMMSAADKMRADFGLEIPIETVPLPSCGKTYPTTSTLSGSDTIEIRSMTAREEDILTSRALLKKGTVITELIKSCMVDRSINPIDMLSGDRNALMVAIRVTGYGAEYDADVECPECSVKSKQQFDLAALQVKRLELDPVIPGANVFEFLLPFCKKTVKFRFLTGRDEEEIMATAEKQKKLGISSDNAVTTSLLHSIISIDGIEDRAKIASFVKMMPARDSLALRNYIRDNEPGIAMKQDMVCDSCGATTEVSIPMGVGFLWPSSK